MKRLYWWITQTGDTPYAEWRPPTPRHPEEPGHRVLPIVPRNVSEPPVGREKVRITPAPVPLEERRVLALERIAKAIEEHNDRERRRGAFR